MRPDRVVARFSCAVVIALVLIGHLLAQSKDWPFSTGSPPSNSPRGSVSPTPKPGTTPPPLGAPLQQKRWEQLSNAEVSSLGAQVLAVRASQWYHGETENFIVHYRNFGDAMQVAREIEFNLWYVAKSLGASKDQYARKSHVYAFQDQKEWEEFLRQSHHSSWPHSFALGDELFLNLHGTGHGFDSQTLAHETTHAVVSRIYGRRRWPLWLSEGFAEYMGDACNAARRALPPSANPRQLRVADMTLTELFAVSRYPEELSDVSRLYDTSTKFVRYLFTKYPAELFPKFVERLLGGATPATALVEVYGDEFRDLTAFEKRFQTLVR